MASQELPEGTVTILFTDVVGSTALTNRLGDEAARDVFRASDDLVRRQVERHRGQEVKGTGDGLMVAFTSARRAVACAVDIQRAVAERGRREPGRVVGIRIGLNTGEVIREEADLYGATVNAAARIADRASAGEILVSDTLKGLLGPATTVELEARGEMELKGFPEPWRIHAVRWEDEAAAPVLMERTPYVGREGERAQLRRCLEQAGRGEGALVMIGGEPGVGKTRLAQEMAREARDRGFLALTGHCYDMEGAPPYIAFVEVLEAASRFVPPETLREALGEAAPEVAKLMPELRRMFPDIPPAAELPPEQGRRYVFNSVREFIERVSRVQPLLLVLEDLHWGDDSTLLLAQHVAQQLSEMPVLVMGTYRDVELGMDRPLAKALEELTRQRLARDMPLARLPEGDVATMLRAGTGQEPPDRLLRVIYRETEGNPFFVEEVLKHLAEAGKLFDAEGHWLSDLEVGEEEVPRSVRLVIGRRLERVSEECRLAITAAAIVGRAFSYELLQELADVEEDALLDAVDEAERAQLVSSAAESGKARFTFVHEQIRQTLLADLSLPRRQRLHLRAAQAIERTHANAHEEHAADLAHHLYHAGAIADTEKTVRYLTLAGERALTAAAFEDALRHYKHALSLQPAEDGRGYADVLFGRGLAERGLGHWDEALTDWRQALAIYERQGDAEAIGRVSADITQQLGWGARYVEALEVSQRALVGLEGQVSADRCRLLASGAVILSMTGSYETAEGMLEEAMTMAEEMADERLLGEVLGYKAFHHYAYSQVPEQAEAGRRAADLLRSAGDLWSLATVLVILQYGLQTLGRLDEDCKVGEELEPLATRLGHVGALMTVRRSRGGRELMLTGDLGRFEEFVEADIEFCRSAGLPWGSQSYGYLGHADFWRGRQEQALESFREAAKREPPGFAAGYDWAQLFLCTAHAGDKDTALTMMSERPGDAPRLGQPNTQGAWGVLAATAEGLAVLGEREEAARLYPLLLEFVRGGRVVWGTTGRLAETVAGIGAACGRRWEEAENHYRTALRQAHEIPNKIAQPEVRRWYARMLLDRDRAGDPSAGSASDRDKARQLLTEAAAMYRDMGMPKHVEMAEEMLGEV